MTNHPTTDNWCDYCYKDIDGGFAVGVGMTTLVEGGKEFPLIRIACDECRSIAEEDIYEPAHDVLWKEWYG